MSDPEKELFYKLIYTSFFVPLILAGILIWFIIFYQKKKYKTQLEKKDLLLREQNLIISKQQALEAERTRIAGEMHDDLGGGLTTIRFLSQKVLKNIKNDANRSSINKIVRHAQNLVTNMSEIIWAMNAGFDTLNSLIAYSRRYANEYLGEHDIRLEFKTIGNIINHQLSGEKRRHIFLVIKEALHNVVKHADASDVKIIFDVNEHLNIKIKDNGIGIKTDQNLLGNGIKNIQNRIDKLSGEVKFLNEDGMTIKIAIPLSNEQLINCVFR